MRQVLLAEQDAVPGASVRVDAGQRVQLGVHPVQAVVAHVWGQTASETLGTLGCSQNQWAAPRLPRVMPLGHTMLSVTRATRSIPFKPHFSIFACSPQSVQYIKLRWRQR